MEAPTAAASAGEPGPEVGTKAKEETSVLIMGHRVVFPAGKTPFPAQLAVMSSTLAALRRKQHALVESPTGSGKTLALLCSCLSFQRQHVRETVEARDEAKQLAAQQRQQQEKQQAADVQPEPKRVRRERPIQSSAATSTEPEERVVPPRIYFCSRTHSQLTQAVNELKRCPASYMQAPEFPKPARKDTVLLSCVLGSKRRFCVNTEVNAVPSQVDDKCQEVRMRVTRRSEFGEPEEGGCGFSQSNFGRLRHEAPDVWDVEDLSKLAVKCDECAYYYSKSLLEKAHIVFCPYNYILDASIRAAVGISLQDAIVVLDEAHNVEDTCRSGASLELTDSVLEAAVKSFDHVIWNSEDDVPEGYSNLRECLTRVRKWFNDNAEHVREPLDVHDDNCHVLWSADDAAAMIRACVHSVASRGDVEDVVMHEQQVLASRGVRKVLLSSMALNTAQRVVSLADYMLRDDCKNAEDFKLLIRKKMMAAAMPGSDPDVFKDAEIETKLCIWCLNAVVAFSDVASQARSVILASGTLSPMESFAGELGADFPVRLEANHVVNMRQQVLVGSVLNGPGRVDLLSTFKNQQKLGYQDSMGTLLLQYAQVIPGGVLMFFPSYSLMATLVARWKRSGLWERLQEHKEMFCEPRIGGKDFDALLEHYRATVALYSVEENDPSGWSSGGIDGEVNKTGAIFLAVFRGKVSEGIDFSDENARAVLAVGIPYPSFKDLQVSLKREYQDKKSRENSNLVNGSRWYALQAFRALNQALGRCIRHRRDYGAILLLDSRHEGKRHARSLSKWMRPHLREFMSSGQSSALFAEFFRRNREELPVPRPSSPRPSRSPPPSPSPPNSTPEPGPVVLQYEEDFELKPEPDAEYNELVYP